MKITKSFKNKKLIALAICIVLLVLAGVSFYLYRSKDNTSSVNNQGVNYSPPTDQEMKETEEFKNKRVDDYNKSNQSANTQSNKKTVTPVIINVGQYGESITTNAFVQSVVEDGGKCTFIFTMGSKTVTKISDGFSNATTTTCTPLSFNKTELGVGNWSVVLNYSSATSEGKSQSSTLQVK